MPNLLSSCACLQGDMHHFACHSLPTVLVQSAPSWSGLNLRAVLHSAGCKTDSWLWWPFQFPLTLRLCSAARLLRSAAAFSADKVEAALQERARLDYTAAVVRDTVQTTKTTAQRLRFALATSGLARGVLYSAQYFRRPRRGAR